MIGREDQVGIRLESSYGVEGAGDIIWIPCKDPKWTPKIEYAEDDSAMGRREAPLESDIVGKYAEIQLNCVVYHLAIGHLLNAAYGLDTPAAQDAPNAAVYDHTFTVPNTNALPSYTIYFKNGIQNLKMKGCKLNVFEFVTENKDYAMANCAFLGKMPETSTETPSYSNAVFGKRFTSAMAQFKHASAVSGLAAADNSTFESLRLVIENNLTADFETGDSTEAVNLAPLDMEPGVRKVRGDATIKFRNTTYYDLFNGATDQALTFKVVNSNVTIGDDQNPTIDFTVAKTKCKEWDRDNDKDGPVKQTMQFHGHLDLDEGFMDKCILTNTETDY